MCAPSRNGSVRFRWLPFSVRVRSARRRWRAKSHGNTPARCIVWIWRIPSISIDCSEDPGLVLDELRGLVVIDEVQRRPDLFPILRVLVDRRPLPARFLVLGSAFAGPDPAVFRVARRDGSPTTTLAV